MKRLFLYFVLALTLISPNALTAGDCNEIPTQLAVNNANNGSATLSWAVSPNAQNYTLTVSNGNNNATPFNVVATLTGTSYVVTGLTPGLNYKFKVRTRCTNGDKSNWSPWFNFNSTGGGGGACTLPTGVATSSITTTTASFVWNAVPASIRYEVKVEDGNNNPNDFLNVQNVTTNSSSVSGLVPGQSYKIRLRTRCLAGVKTDWSAPIFFNTPATSQNENQTSVERTEGTFGDNLSMKVFPNPAKDLLAISFNGVAKSDVRFSLMDLSGKTVISTTISNAVDNDTETIDLTQLTSGMYLLKMENAGYSKITKVVVQR